MIDITVLILHCCLFLGMLECFPLYCLHTCFIYSLKIQSDLVSYNFCLISFTLCTCCYLENLYIFFNVLLLINIIICFKLIDSFKYTTVLQYSLVLKSRHANHLPAGLVPQCIQTGPSACQILWSIRHLL